MSPLLRWIEFPPIMIRKKFSRRVITAVSITMTHGLDNKSVGLLSIKQLVKRCFLPMRSAFRSDARHSATTE